VKGTRRRPPLSARPKVKGQGGFSRQRTTALAAVAPARASGARARAARARAAGGPRAQAPVRPPDSAGMERAVADFLRAAGVPMTRIEIAQTARRVAEAWAEDLLRGYGHDPAAEMAHEEAPAGEGLVVLRDIGFHSMCVHHLLPFFGRAHVAYLPRRRLAGLSKIARVVDTLARRLQVQERLTEGIVSAIEASLEPAGTACVVEAEHMCVACRGIRKPGVRIVTTRFTGRLAAGPRRAEALRLLLPEATGR